MKYSTKKIFRDYAATITVAVGLAILIRTYLFEAYRIPSQSMKPALLAGDTIFVGKSPPSLGKNTMPNRGDIIVFTYPSDASKPYKGTEFIRRVVALPGDSIALKKGHLFLNGAPLQANNGRELNAPCFQEKFPENVEYRICLESPTFPDFGPEKVPESSVFVIEDSRMVTQQNLIQQPQGVLKRKGWGVIPLASIKGKALWIWLSIEEAEQSKWLPKFRWERMFRRI